MSPLVSLLLELVVFCLVVVSIGFLAYEMGEYSGMKYFCQGGVLVEVDGLVVCESDEGFTSFTTFSGLEVDLNG